MEYTGDFHKKRCVEFSRQSKIILWKKRLYLFCGYQFSEELRYIVHVLTKQKVYKYSISQDIFHGQTLLSFKLDGIVSDFLKY